MRFELTFDMLSNSTKYLFEALNELREPLCVVDRSLNCLFANRALAELVGLATNLNAPTLLTSFWPSAKASDLNQEDVSASFVLHGKSSFRAKLAVTKLGDGCVLIRVLAGAIDSDASQSFHSQRLETLGMLAGGVAHDFNNVLAGILGHITYLKTILPQSGTHVESLGAIEEGARKASSLTQQILNFSRLDDGENISRIDLGDLVDRTCKLLRGAVSREYNLEWICPDIPVNVLGIEGKLAQIIVNLVINARDAVQIDGQITVGISIVEDRETLDSVFHGADRSSIQYAVLVVEDNGHGIPANLIDKVFEPYFSTKKDKGTGLGLFTVSQIVRSFGGAIDIQSGVGSGTKMSVYLPVVDGQAGSRPQVSGESFGVALEGGTESILVVDDEYPVRNVICMSLEHLGYKVQNASSGVEAIDRYRTLGGVDLVILDMIMPVLSGDEVYLRLRELDPDVRALVISGYTSELSVKKIMDNGGRGFMQKPFTIHELSRKVRECLDSRVK